MYSYNGRDGNKMGHCLISTQDERAAIGIRKSPVTFRGASIPSDMAVFASATLRREFPQRAACRCLHSHHAMSTAAATGAAQLFRFYLTGCELPDMGALHVVPDRCFRTATIRYHGTSWPWQGFLFGLCCDIIALVRFVAHGPVDGDHMTRSLGFSVYRSSRDSSWLSPLHYLCLSW